MSFSENLQFLRTRNSITQEQLAEQLDVSRQSVSKWESGASFPEMDTLLRICDLYSVDLDTLLRGSVEASQVSDTARYDDFMTCFIRRMTLAIGAIIAAVGGMPIFNVLGLPEMLSVAFLLLVITVSVVTIVASGMQYDRFCKKNPTIPDFYSQEEKDAFGQKFIWYIAGGVGGILFGLEFVGGLLVGATIVAIPRAIFMGNSGGAFDNAKKYIEGGFLDGHGKGSAAHKASVTGDTVGDTRKDVVGVALDIFIKMMSTVANTLATVIGSIRLFK